jgi:DNA-binding response OmpR family regulator/nitrogen-specific signal transduction histidine kinase
MTYQSTVLIVDDEVMIRDTLEGLLLPQGHNLAFATNGVEALAKAAELIPDLILLDVMMPKMDGYKTCERLRADKLLTDVPIIMITALDDRESRLRGIKVGADDFITKPFDFVELQLRVQTITRLNRYRRLLTERHKFEWVVEQDKDGYLILNHNDEIVYANPQARRYLNLPADERELGFKTFLGMSRQQYRCEPETAWATWPVLSPGPSPYYLVRPETLTSESLWLQVEQMRMSSWSNEAYLVHLHDITANVVVKNLMWTFHGQVDHKLKTPLSKLTGFLGILRENGSMLSDEDRESFLAIVDANANQLQDEILKIFQYLEALTQAKRSQSRCSLAEVEAIITKIKTNLELKIIELAFHNLIDPAGTYLPASLEAMELILWELLENAKKFHPSHSPELGINISASATGLQLQIRDDGLTLLPEQLARMWTPYYQVEKYFTGQMPGMGLGLAMVAQLVWSMAGTCQAYNRDDGPGIVVDLVLPLVGRNGAG